MRCNKNPQCIKVQSCRLSMKPSYLVIIIILSTEDKGQATDRLLRKSTRIYIFSCILLYLIQITNNGNWMHIKYQNKMQARYALNKNGKVFGDNIMVGVSMCTDPQVIDGEKSGVFYRQTNTSNINDSVFLSPSNNNNSIVIVVLLWIDKFCLINRCLKLQESLSLTVAPELIISEGYRIVRIDRR
ncbi:unnamed protein product [Trichobilharzia regenti]|nr:unnamed protein product [Trichobilharzia regenti]